MASQTRRLRLPAQAFEWLVNGQNNPHRQFVVLSLSASGSQTADLLNAGHNVITVASHSATGKLQRQLSTAGDRLITLVGAPEAIPTQPHVADVLLVQRGLHQPGVAVRQVLSEVARVLKPGGWLAGSGLTRDDTVPWVRRLIELMRSLDPDAMGSSAGAPDQQLVQASQYFGDHQQRDFRVWLPISAADLVAMVREQPSVGRLAPQLREEFLARVSQLYKDSAGVGQLSLPYRLHCWRAQVDHAELTTSLVLGANGLRIKL